MEAYVRPHASISRFGRLRRFFRGTLVWYVFITPPFLLILVFVAYPTFEAFRQSVYRQVGSHQEFAGLDQYQRLAGSGIFWQALGNTIVLGAAFLIIVLPLATVLASLLNRVK